MNIFALAYGNQPDSGILIGKNLKNGHPIRLKNYQSTTAIIGASGTGKTNLMNHSALEAIARHDTAVVVLDPHSDLVRDIVSQCPPQQAHRLIYFDPYTQFREGKKMLGFNPFQVKDLVAEYEEKAQAIMNVFAHSWYGGFHNAPLLQNTLETLIRTLILAYPHCQTSFLHMLLLTELSGIGDYWRQRLAPFVAHNAALSQNWREWADDIRRTQLKADIISTRQKVKHVLVSDIVSSVLFQPSSAACFDFANLIANKGVLLVGLRGLGEEGIRLIGSLILTQLLATVKVTAENERLPCHIYADEFHNFSPESFVEIIDQTRKFNLFCTVAHQRLNQLNDKTISAVANCDNTIVFRVHPDDAQKLRKHFTTSSGYLSPKVMSKFKDWEALIEYKDGRDIEQAGFRVLDGKRPQNSKVDIQIRRQSLQQGRTLAEIHRYQAEVERFSGRHNDDKDKPMTSASHKSNKRPVQPNKSDLEQKGKPSPNSKSKGSVNLDSKQKGKPSPNSEAEDSRFRKIIKKPSKSDDSSANEEDALPED